MDFASYMGRRYHLQKGNEFEFARIGIEDSNGEIRSENGNDYRSRPLIAPHQQGSEGASSVIHVHDLGLAAAWILVPELTKKTSLRNVMDATQLRNFLGLETDASRNVSDSIRAEVKLKLAKASGYDGGTYLPINEINRIFGIESIKSLIKEGNILGKNVNLELVIYSCISRRRILGILLLLDELNYLKDFIRENITDDDLPLRRADSYDETRTFIRTSERENTTLFKGWKDNHVELFYVYQPRFFVPFFDIQDDKLCSYDLGNEIRLPWQRYETKSSGGNGVVHMVQIHPSHHNYKPAQPLDKPLYFALKEIDTHDKDTYHQELSALEKVCAQIQKEKHLIKLLLTFKHGQKYYFLFEWADGNLSEYWHTYPSAPQRSIEKKIWAATQCLGLATAVKRIHGLATWQKRRRGQLQSLGISSWEDGKEYGRHGDIKPNNILWFASYGDRFVVSDLGLTRFHSSITRSHVHHTNIDGYSLAYRAPEIDDPRQSIGQSYDIWSLGCVFLEFCTWWILGLKGVEEFRNDRLGDYIEDVVKEATFFTVTQSGQTYEAQVKSSVTKRIKELRDKSIGDAFATGMLRLVEEDMLVVDNSRRSRADEICAAIHTIIGNITQPESMPTVRVTIEQEKIRDTDMLTTTAMLAARNMLHIHATGGPGGDVESLERKRAPSLTLTMPSSTGDPCERPFDRQGSINARPPESCNASFHIGTPETTEQPTQTSIGNPDDSSLFTPVPVSVFRPTVLARAAHNDCRMPSKTEGLIHLEPNISTGANSSVPSHQQPKGKFEAEAPPPQEPNWAEPGLSFFQMIAKKMFSRKGERRASSAIYKKKWMKNFMFKKHAA